MLKILPRNSKLSFEDFYQQNYNRALNYVRNKITVSEEAEDLVSDVFLYCYNHFDSYDPVKSSPTTWLYLIINSRIKNYYRDHSITYVDFESVADTMQDQGINLDQGIYIEQLHNALMTAIHNLPQRQQQIVMMRYFENRTSDEIALKLGLSPGNVRVLLSRALNKLSTYNDGYWKEFKDNG